MTYSLANPCGAGLGSASCIRTPTSHYRLRPGLPWSLDPAYRKKPDEDFAISAEETELKELYGLDDEQLAWRRAKQQQLGERLPQEFPLIASEAFISSSFDSFIPPALVIKARKERIEDDFGWGLIVGVDPAGMGPDRTSVAWRRGRRILKVESRRHMDTMEVAGWVQKIIREDKPEKVNIDVGGLGVGVYDRLREQGVKRVGGNEIRPRTHKSQQSRCPLAEGLCCKTRFALVLKNSKGCQRDFRVKMCSRNGGQKIGITETCGFAEPRG